MGVLSYLTLAFTHPTELRSLVTYSVWHDHRNIKDPKQHVYTGWDRESMKECWGLLDLTSRSFAMVVKELEGDLARIVCIFYLVLRALDTVEDDMTLPNSEKLPLLRALYKKLDEPGWTFNGSGPNEADRDTLVKFDRIIEEYGRLEERYRIIIQDSCRKMGRGMAAFAALSTPELPVAEVDSIANYDLYCHHVAGIVGEGLSRLFVASGKERDFIKDQLTLSNHMALLLQKTNILRDFREDVDEGRGFWPKAIWGKYGFEKMGDMRDESREQEALWALSEMTLDALRHITPALDYLTLLKNQSVFNFVAIPSVMAIATLERCYGNPDVLRKNVKIRKGEAVKLMMGATNPRDVAITFVDYAKKIHAKVKVEDPNYVRLSIACGKIEQWLEHHYPSFVEISNTSTGLVTTVNLETGDARARLYQLVLDKEKEVQVAKRIQEGEARRKIMMDDLRARGVIGPAKESTEGEKKEVDKYNHQTVVKGADDGIPWTLVLVAGGTVLAIIASAAIVVFACIYFFDEDYNSKRVYSKLEL